MIFIEKGTQFTFSKSLHLKNYIYNKWIQLTNMFTV